MAMFKDLDPLPYFGKWQHSLKAVGWLERGSKFAQGAVSEGFFAALVALCVDPWQPGVMAGRQPCSFCRFTGGSAQLAYRGMTVDLGTANLFVPAADCVLVAPTMIVHYIDAHEYAPPMVFQEAVMKCPKMKSVAYLKELKSRGISLKDAQGLVRPEGEIN